MGFRVRRGDGTANLLVLVASLLLLPAYALGDSERVTYSVNGNHYQRFDSAADWATAAAACEGLGGYLATVHSEGENEFIFLSIFVDSAWLGGSQPAASGEPLADWEWVSGEDWSFSAWDSGEPNNGGGDREEDCLVMWSTGTGDWNDLECTDEEEYICEWDGEPPVPAMSSWSLYLLAVGLALAGSMALRAGRIAG